MTNCLFYALALYWRRKAKGRRCYLALRRSEFTRLPHFLVFELRHGHYRVISYKPNDPRGKKFPPPVFAGDPRWGDQPNPSTPTHFLIHHPPKEIDMSDSNYKPDGTGVVMGDTKAMPNRGTGTGMTGYDTHGEGMSLDMDATNAAGTISGATGSDPAGECYPDDPTFGPAKGDAAEDAAEDKASY